MGLFPNYVLDILDAGRLIGQEKLLLSQEKGPDNFGNEGSSISRVPCRSKRGLTEIAVLCLQNNIG